METITKENYNEYVLNYYKPYQADCLRVIDQLNATAVLHGYRDIPEITVRCFNATTRTVKFFNKFNMNYYDNSLTNEDRPIMIAVEHYIYEKMIKAKISLNDYIKEMNKLADKLVKTPEFKIFDRFGKQIQKITGFQPNFSKYYASVSSYMEEYLKAVNEISNFEIEDKLEEVILYYLPYLYQQVSKTKFTNNVPANLIIVNRFFMERVSFINKSLTKIGRQELIPTVINNATTIMNEKLAEEKNKYNEEQSKKKERKK